MSGWGISEWCFLVCRAMCDRCGSLYVYEHHNMNDYLVEGGVLIRFRGYYRRIVVMQLTGSTTAAWPGRCYALLLRYKYVVQF